MLRSAALSLLLFLSVGANASTLRVQADSLRSCCLKKNDVDVMRLLSATRQYCDLMQTFGRFIKPSVANLRSCIDKVAAGRHALRSKLKTCRELLNAEAERGIHRPGGVLADPSAAMGLLWLRRGLEYWADVWEQQVEFLCGKRVASTLKEQSKVSYDRNVLQYHGWVSRRAFGVALRMTPEWCDVRARAGLSESDEDLREELTALVSASRELCLRLRQMQIELDLEDTRKSV
jgi:hypothetical protein